MYDWCKECTREFRSQCDQDAENCEALNAEIKEYIKKHAYFGDNGRDWDTNASNWSSEFTNNYEEDTKG